MKFGSNFQPFVRKREVSHSDDEDMTREPEMVQAYRDTWELVHSYLTYLRDRLRLARDLLHPSGSIFVQISDENLHHVREVMDEVFGAENFCALINYATTTSQTAALLPATEDHLIWFTRDRERVKFHRLFVEKDFREIVRTTYNKLELTDGTIRPMTSDEIEDPFSIPPGAKILSLTIQHRGLEARQRVSHLAAAKRLHAKGSNILYRRYYTDFPYVALTHSWPDTQFGGFVKSEEKALCSSDANKASAALYSDNHRPRRFGFRPDVRERDDGVCGRAVGAALDYH